MDNFNNKKAHIFWATALFVYSGLIFFLSSQPVEIPGPSFFLKDKLIHATAYGLMAFLAWRFFLLVPFISHPTLWAWIYTFLYGGSDEWHQSFVPGRHADIWDWLADGAGAAIILIILHYKATRKR